MKPTDNTLTVRYEVFPGDPASIGEIVASSGFFRPDEIPVAVELADERLSKGAASGYEFVIAEADGRMVGYACYGLIPCTLRSYDLYWIATRQDRRGTGIGKRVLTEVEQSVKALGGKTIYVETSYLPKYEPTRQFYLKNGYIEKARFEDFYDDGDDKVVFVKTI